MSGVGDDANPCSRTAPCKTFAGAISKTNAGGAISVLDPGGYGAVTITKSITIQGSPEVASILATGINGIVVNTAASDTVNLIGLGIEGAGSGTNGIRIVGSGKITVSGCVIDNFTGLGIDAQGSGDVRLMVRDSLITGNAGGGMRVQASGGVYGVFISGTTFDLNGNFAYQSSGSQVQTIVSDTDMIRSPGGLSIVSGATVTSYGNNRIRNGNPPTTTIPQN